MSDHEDEAADPAIEDIRRHNEQWGSLAKRERAAQALAMWSGRWAPAPISADAIINSWRDDEDDPGGGPVFIEDAVREIFEGMGLPRFDLIANVMPTTE